MRTISRSRCRRSAAMNPARSGSPASAAASRCAISPGASAARRVARRRSATGPGSASRARLVADEIAGGEHRGQGIRAVRATDSEHRQRAGFAHACQLLLTVGGEFRCHRRGLYSKYPLADAAQRPTILVMKTRLAALAGAAAVSSLGACAKQERVREIDWAKAALARNPAYEIVATDESRACSRCATPPPARVSTLRLEDLIAAPLPPKAATRTAAQPAPAAPRSTTPRPWNPTRPPPRAALADQTTETVKAVPRRATARRSPKAGLQHLARHRHAGRQQRSRARRPGLQHHAARRRAGREHGQRRSGRVERREAHRSHHLPGRSPHAHRRRDHRVHRRRAHRRERLRPLHQQRQHPRRRRGHHRAPGARAHRQQHASAARAVPTKLPRAPRSTWPAPRSPASAGASTPRP